jgi:hypothetical protein
LLAPTSFGSVFRYVFSADALPRNFRSDFAS